MTTGLELVPTLESCIETTARREYERTLHQLLADDGDQRSLWEKLELLTWFLSMNDLRQLRALSERHLLEGKTVRFLIHRDGANVSWRMEVGD